jgi:hypothetical protein
LLAVVPALADDAMEAHEFGVHRDVNEADQMEEFLAQNGMDSSMPCWPQ